jgi:hypothetical protein
MMPFDSARHRRTYSNGMTGDMLVTGKVIVVDPSSATYKVQPDAPDVGIHTFADDDVMVRGTLCLSQFHVAAHVIAALWRCSHALKPIRKRRDRQKVLWFAQILTIHSCKYSSGLYMARPQPMRPPELISLDYVRRRAQGQGELTPNRIHPVVSGLGSPATDAHKQQVR